MTDASIPKAGTRNFVQAHWLVLEVSILVAIVTIAALLIFPDLGNQSLWFDEIYTSYLAKEPARVAFAVFDRADVSAAAVFLTQSPVRGAQYSGSTSLLAPAEILANPPLYYLIVAPFLQLGQSEFVTRLPSAIFGIASLPVIFFLGRKLFGTAEGIIGAIFLAASQMAIWAATEARSYSLLMLLSLLNLLFLYEAIIRGRRRDWLSFLVASLLMVNTHYYGFAFLVLEGLFLVLWKSKAKIVGGKDEVLLSLDKLRSFALCFGATVIINPLSALMALGVLTPPELYAATLGWRYAYHASFSASAAFLYARNLLIEFSGPGDFTARLFLVLFLLGIASLGAPRWRAQTALLAMLFVVPATMLLLLPTIDFRYMIFALPPFLLLSAKGVTFAGDSVQWLARRLQGKNHDPRRFLLKQGLSLALLITASLVVVPQLQAFRVSEDWRSTAQYLNQNTMPGDVVISEPFITQLCVQYYVAYLSGKSAPIPLLSFTTSRNVTFLQPDPSAIDINNYATSYRSVWLVVSEKYLNITYVNQPQAIKEVNDSISGAPFLSQVQFSGPIVVYHLAERR